MDPACMTEDELALWREQARYVKDQPMMGKRAPSVPGRGGSGAADIRPMSGEDEPLVRLMRGEVLFLRGVDHADVNSQASHLYGLVRQRGRYLHIRQATTRGGMVGLRAWVDDVPRRKARPEPRLASIVATGEVL